MRNLNILVTGASGFIGSNLAKALGGHNLFLLTHKTKLAGIRGTWIKQDLAQPLLKNKLPKKLDVIIHEAATEEANMN